MFKNALICLLFSAFTAFFGAVYEVFSHEVYSYFMIYAFAIPLIPGALLFLILGLYKKRLPGRTAVRLWNSGLAALTVGSLFRGVLEIYGTTNRLLIVYVLAGAALLLSGIICHLAASAGRREAASGTGEIRVKGRTGRKNINIAPLP